MILKYDMKKENDRRHTKENSLHTISNIWMLSPLTIRNSLAMSEIKKTKKR